MGHALKNLLHRIQKYPVPWAMAFCLALVLSRATQRLTFAELTAEDGLWFQQALEHGWRTLFWPYVGSLFVFQRLVLLSCLTFFSFAAIPTAVMLANFATLAFISAAVVSPTYRWLWPSDRVRWLMAGLLCLLPGTVEMAGNVANVNWILFVGVALVAFRPAEAPTKLWHALYVALACLSSGSFVLLLPLFAWRTARVPRARRLRESTPLLIACVVVALLFFLERIHDDRFTMTFTRQAVEAVNTFLDGMILQPWIGDWPTIPVSNAAWPLRAAILAGFLAYAAAVTRRHGRAPWFQAIGLFTGAMFFWPVLCWIARPGRIEYFEMALAGGFWKMRYSYPLAMTAVFFWPAVLERITLARAHAVAIGFLLLNVTWGIYRFRLPAVSQHHTWPATAPRLETAYRTGCPAALEVPFAPDGWKFVFRSPKGCSVQTSEVKLNFSFSSEDLNKRP